MGERDDDHMPAVAWHRGCAIQDGQSDARIEHVKRAIDRIHVLSLDDAAELITHAGDPANPPESRLYAAARLEALWQLASEERRNRPAIDLDRVRACVAGLASRRWRDSDRFCSLLDIHCERAVKRETPLPDEDLFAAIDRQAALS